MSVKELVQLLAAADDDAIVFCNIEDACGTSIYKEAIEVSIEGDEVYLYTDNEE